MTPRETADSFDLSPVASAPRGGLPSGHFVVVGTDRQGNYSEGEDPEGRDALLSVKILGDWRARDENDLHYWSGSQDL